MHLPAFMNPVPGANVMLASASPRRRQLLGMIVPDFSTAPARDIDESFDPSLPAVQVARHLSRIKSDAYADLVGPGDILITADTVVICNGNILGKPHDAVQARRMLNSLSGNTHTVMTGITVRTSTRTDSFDVTTGVTFGPLDDDQIENYISVFSPFDKAGAYGIQEWIGAVGITGITGDYYNVMGLPLNALYHALKNLQSY